MKKILVLLAAAMLIVACSGNSGKKGDDKKSDNTEQNDKKSKKVQSVEEKAAEFATRICEAQLAGDQDESLKIQDEMASWMLTLSETELANAEKVYFDTVDKWVSENIELHEDDSWEDVDWENVDWDDEVWDE